MVFCDALRPSKCVLLNLLAKGECWKSLSSLWGHCSSKLGAFVIKRKKCLNRRGKLYSFLLRCDYGCVIIFLVRKKNNTQQIPM